VGLITPSNQDGNGLIVKQSLLSRCALFGAALLTGAAGLSSVANAQGRPPALTQQQCNDFRAVALMVAREPARRSPQTGQLETLNISNDFRNSIGEFITEKRDCSGRRDIATPAVDDVIAYNIISRTLYAGSSGFDMTALGFRSVAARATR
jgi:hypothetical protein